ncbi:MBL fold metallo-hydrolase [Paenibacillus gansuensis]|uniref:MBL fold metallo-hydrolase n=1 Tax=Paenibacillus gansuensis TaxID=306542 RepID=A0ABW5PAE3_9BACL
MKKFSYDQTTVFQSAMFQTTSTVVELEDLILVVDPNSLPEEISEIRAHVDAVKGAKPVYVLFTHGDYDHIIGYNAFSDALTIGSAEMRDHPKKDFKVGLIREFDAAYYITREYEVEFPHLDYVIEQDGEQLTIGSTVLTFYKAPGHTRDSLFTIVGSLGLLLAGDYLSDFELPFMNDSSKAYEETMRKAERILDEHGIRLLVPGHGVPTEDRGEMAKRIAMADSYLQRLKEAVLREDDASLKEMEREFRFYSPMTVESHEENIKIMRREYQ